MCLEKPGDVFFIERRLKEINPRYELYFNKLTKKHEVYILQGDRLVLQFVCPYDSLDARLIRYARQTSVKNLDKIIKQIETDNENLLKKEEEQKRVLAKEKAKELAQKIKRNLY